MLPGWFVFCKLSDLPGKSRFFAMILYAHKLWDTRLGPFRRLAAHGNPPKCKKFCSIKSWVDYKKRTYPIIQHLKRSFFWNSHHTSSISLNQSHFPTSSVSPAPGTTKEASENFRSIPYMALCCPGVSHQSHGFFSPQQLQGLCRVCTFTKGRLAVRL